MAYKMFLAGVLMPVTPAKVNMEISNQNKIITLINGEEVNLLAPGGLKEISFDLLLPGAQYPFAVERQYRPASYYLRLLANLKEKCQPFRWIWTRTDCRGAIIDSENLLVSLEDYQISEDAEDGIDMVVSVKLKAYRACIGRKQTVGSAGSASSVGSREQEHAPNATSYTVQKGDSLWLIAKKQLGDGARYQEIYNLNKGVIANPNLIYPGQRLQLP